MKCKTDCFESGEAKWSIINDENEQVVAVENLSGDLNLLTNLVGFKKFKLRVDLSKGNGSNAFQHTQLFRQKLDDINLNLFEIEFIFE